MIGLILNNLLTGLLAISMNGSPKYDYIMPDAGLRISFPVMYRDSSWTQQGKRFYRAWANDGHSEYVVECEEVELLINFKDWSWKTPYDTRLKAFYTKVGAEKTEESRYDLGKIKGLDAILNLIQHKETIFYRNVITHGFSYTIYIKQPRGKLNDDKVQKFRKSFRMIKIRKKTD
ncbi:MAG: hypothetical protein IAE67_06770 [Candidatus Competibacteraceae bacterium]|nr:hypothetical protein [Candidatus Competibacteraceae bacterium]